MRPEQARVKIDGLLEETLKRHSLRVRASHNRARADAGPSLKSGMRSFDHYTYEYVRQTAHEYGMRPSRESLAELAVSGRAPDRGHNGLGSGPAGGMIEAQG